MSMLRKVKNIIYAFLLVVVSFFVTTVSKEQVIGVAAEGTDYAVSSNGIKYETIEEALDVCAEGVCNMTLLKDVSTTSALYILSGTEVTLDLAGFILSDFVTISLDNSSLVINDSSLNKTGKIINSDNVGAISIFNHGSLEVNAGILINEEESGGANVIINNQGTVALNGGRIESYYATAIINRGSLVIGENQSALNGDKIVVKGEIYGVDNSGEFAFYNGSIMGATGAYTGLDLTARANSTTAVYDVLDSEKTYKALQYNLVSVGSNDYVTVQSAIDACTSECTLLLLGDIEQVGFEIPVGKTILLNLNGYTLTISSESIVVKGNLTVKTSGSGKVNSEDVVIRINNNGKLLLESGEITSAYIAVLNQGTMIMNKGTIKTEGTHPAIRNYQGTVELHAGLVESGGSEAIKNEGVLQVGRIDDELNEESIIVKGATYGVYTEEGTEATLNFYNGSIWGKTKAYSDHVEISAIREGYDTFVESVSEYKVLKYAVVSMGESKYSNVFAALNACDEECEIKLLLNIKLEYSLSISDKNVTMDLNGHVLTVKDFIEVSEGATLIVKDTSENKTGKIVADVGNTNEVIFVNGGTFVLNSGTIINENNIDDAWAISNYGTVTILGGLVEAKYSAAIYNNEGVVTIGDKEAEYDDESIIVRGATYGIENDEGEINFYNGSVYAVTSYITGQIEGKRTDLNLASFVKEVDEIEYKVTKYAAVLVDNTYYDSIEEAINDCDGECTLLLLGDIERVGFEIPVGKTILLNLNGYTLTISSESIVVKGNLTVKTSGSGKVNSEDVVIRINNNGKLLLESGEITSAYIAVLNQGTMIMNKGTIKTEGTHPAIRNYQGTVELHAGLVESGGSEAIKNEGVLQVGRIDDELNEESIVVKGATYGVYTEEGTEATLNFYNGSIWGKTKAYSDYVEISAIREGYDTFVESVSVYKVLKYAVVSMGESKYSNVFAALNACDEECEIKLLRSIEIVEILQIDDSKKITIDINGHVLTMKDFIEVSEGAILTVKDSNESNAGKIVADVENTNEVIFVNGGTFVLNSGTIINENNIDDAWAISNYGTVTILGGLVEAKYSAAIYSEGVVTIGDKEAEYNASSIIVRGATYGIYNDGGEVNFYNGSILGKEEAINSEFKETRNDYQVVTYNDEYAGSSYKVNKYAKVSVGDKYYLDIYEALASCTQECTVKLLANMELTSPLLVNKNMTVSIDLNGKAIKSKIVHVEGTLVINDTAEGGSIEGEHNSELFTVVEDALLIINKGSMINKGSNENSYVINNEGNVIINGGLIESIHTHAINSTGTLTIGDKEEAINHDSPIIRGAKYGVKSTSDINFYNGSIWGKTNSNDGQIADFREGLSYGTIRKILGTTAYYVLKYMTVSLIEGETVTSFDSIDSAISNCEGECEIKLLDNIAEDSVYFPEDVTVILNTNGYTIEVSAKYIVKGTVDIIGNGKIVSNSVEEPVFEVEGTLTLSAVEVESASNYAISNFGILNVKGESKVTSAGQKAVLNDGGTVEGIEFDEVVNDSEDIPNNEDKKDDSGDIFGIDMKYILIGAGVLLFLIIVIVVIVKRRRSMEF